MSDTQKITSAEAQPEQEIASINNKLPDLLSRENLESLPLILTRIEIGYWMARANVAHKILLEQKERDPETGQLVNSGGGFKGWLEEHGVARSSAYEHIATAHSVGLTAESDAPDFNNLRAQLEEQLTLMGDAIGGIRKLPALLKKGPTTCENCQHIYPPHLTICPECKFDPSIPTKEEEEKQKPDPKTLWKRDLRSSVSTTLAGLQQARQALSIVHAHKRSIEAQRAENTLAAELKAALEEITEADWDMLPPGKKPTTQFDSYKEEFLSN
ncbi:MAG: hypothetical protein ACPG32_15660 [Akkermansiaceae bacterium]